MSDLKINALIKKLEDKLEDEVEGNVIEAEYYIGVNDCLELAKQVRDSIQGEGHMEIKVARS